MTEPSKVIILYRENEKLVSEIRGRDEATNRILKINEELRLKVIELNMENQDMKKKLAYYENPHSPPSGNNIPARKKVRKKKYSKRRQEESKANKKSWLQKIGMNL